MTSGATWVLPSGNTQTYQIELSSDDGVDVMGAPAWNELPPVRQVEQLTKRADLLVLAQMRKLGAISQEYFEGRVAEVRGK